LSKIA